LESGTKLLLSAGTAQIYYGDESARNLIVEGTRGDATLRSKMNWEDIKSNDATKAILNHWQKLGKFRRDHPSVGAGKHHMMNEAPYIFKRTFQKKAYKDAVVIGLDLKKGVKRIHVQDVFAESITIRDAYSGKSSEVQKGYVEFDTPYDIVLLEIATK
jgi:alpha-amylase